MKRLRLPLFVPVLALLGALLCAQQQQRRNNPDEPPRLPDGRNQMEEILKADHEKTLKDAAELFRLAEDLKIELEKNDRHVLSIAMLKKTEDIEKLAKRIRQRLKRF